MRLLTVQPAGCASWPEMLNPEILLAAFGEWVYSPCRVLHLQSYTRCWYKVVPPLQTWIWLARKFFRWLPHFDDESYPLLICARAILLDSSTVHMDLLSGSVYPENWLCRKSLSGDTCPMARNAWFQHFLHMVNSSSWRLPSAMVPVRRTHYTSGISIPAHFLVVESPDFARGAASFSYSW